MITREKFMAHFLIVRLATHKNIDDLCKNMDFVLKQAIDDSNRIFNLIYTNSMEYTTQVQKAIVAEATALKAFLHKDEAANLDIETFDPTLPHGCVYGQAFGECHSVRAGHALKKCAVPYSTKINEFVEPETDAHFESRKKFVVGHDDVYSILEFAAFNDDTFRHKVIPFLKGEKDILEF